MKLIETLIGLFSGGAAQAAGKLTAAVALIGALAPAVAWIFRNKEDVLTVITVGDLAFYGLVAAFVIAVVYLTRPGHA